MAQLFKILLSIFIIFAANKTCYAALQGSLEYKIPIEYSKMNEEELSSEAEFYYNKALVTDSSYISEDVSRALILYTMLSNKKPQNIIYSVRTGVLYDKLGKNRWAKGNFYKAMGIDPSRPEPYFYLGEFYFNREQYRKALKFYKKAFENGYSSHPTTVIRLKEIYRMLGDTESIKKLSNK